jgi:type II secretory pathway pseudopilin PulG
MSDRPQSQSSQPPLASPSTCLTNHPDGRHRRHRRPADDTGLSLIEVIVAMGLFLILITSSMSVLLLSLKTTAVNRNRVAASNLAGRELEIVRSQFSSVKRGPATVNINEVTNENPLTGAVGSPLVLDNVSYNVTRTATWFKVGSTAVSACDDGTYLELAYLLVNVKVSWGPVPDPASTISMDTILTPSKGTYSSATGHIGVKIRDAAAKGVAGRQVIVTGSGGSVFYGTSAADGCTVFPFLNPGAYTISVDTPPYVDHSGTQKVTLNATIEAGQMWHGSIDYDRSATIKANFMTLDGYNLPSVNDIPVSLGNNGLAGSMARTGLGNSRDVTGLWPYPSGYQLWAGSCLDADPQFAPDPLKPLNVRADPVSAVAGGLTSTEVDLAPVNVTNAEPGAILTAVHFIVPPTPPDPVVPDNACPTGETIRLGNASGAGTLATSLPYGKWTITTGSGRAKQVTLVRGDPPVSAGLS